MRRLPLGLGYTSILRTDFVLRNLTQPKSWLTSYWRSRGQYPVCPRLFSLLLMPARSTLKVTHKL